MQYYRWQVKLINPTSKIEIEICNPLGEIIESPQVDSVVSQIPIKVTELAKKTRNIRTPLKSREIKELGESLYNILFPAEVDNIFRSLLLKVNQNKAVLHLELYLDNVPNISALPWEFMQTPETNRRASNNLSTHPKIVLSRRRKLWVPPSSDISDNSLRILLVVSKPEDKNLGKVVYENVEEALQNLVSDDSLPGKLSLEVLDRATATLISSKLETYQPHVVHFIGHGRFHQKRAQLALIKDNGKIDWRTDEQISELLQGYEPRIMFLQACDSAAQNKVDAFVGIASQIVQRRVPIVIAMQYRITNLVAVTFAEEFYRRLANLEFVDMAVQKSRLYLRNKFQDQHYFAIPVLFMGVNNGQLFQQPSSNEKDTLLVTSNDPKSFSLTITLPPDPPEPFVGRQLDVDRLVDELTHKNGRIIAISGASGVGKSALAKKLGQELQDKFSGHVYWISFKDNSNISAQTILIEMTHILGHPLTLETNAPSIIFNSHIKDLLTKYQCLLIIDGVDLPSELITDLVRCRGKSSILITTQDRNNPYGISYSLKMLSLDEATDLLYSHCKFYLEDKPYEAEYINLICEKLEKHPFMIKEAGGYIVSTQTPPEEYLKLLTRQKLKDFYSDDLLSPLNLRWKKLNESERRLLKVLSLAAKEDIELDAIATGIEASPTSVDKIAKTLVSNSIIDRGRIKQPAKPENASYTMHYLWRRYIRENTLSVAEQIDIRRRLARFYFGKQILNPEIINTYQPITFKMDLVSIARDYTHLQSKSNVPQFTPKSDHAPAESYYRSGLVFYERRHYELALVNFDQAIQINPEYTSAYYERGLTHTKLQQYIQALTDFARVLQLNPDNAQAYASRGVVYTRLKRYQEALADYDWAIQLDPGNLDFQSSRNQIEKISNQDKDVIFEFDETDKFLQFNILRDEALNRDMSLLEQSQSNVVATLYPQSYYKRFLDKQDKEVSTSSGKTHQLHPTDLAIDLFKQAKSIKEMRNAVLRFPFMIKFDFIAIIEELINETEMTGGKSTLEKNLAWLRKIANEQDGKEQPQ